jgi:hypothetical protein
MLFEATTWSPDFKSWVIVVMAAIPDPNAKPSAPFSSAATFFSRAIRVGFWVRAYSKPLCFPRPCWT